jgi:Meckel syndrome type 1 protein
MPVAAQPGAATGIAQAAQAAQAQGPLAGFEALLAAFFGDQGTATAGGAGGAGAAAAQGPLALFAAQTQAGGKAADGKTGKAGGATADGTKTDAKTGAKDQTATAGDAVVDAAAALALLTPGATATPPQTPPAQAVDANAADAQPDAGLAGKPAGQPTLAQLAALTADGKAAKATALGAQTEVAVEPQTQTTPVAADDGKAASAKPQASAAANAAATLPQPALAAQTAAVTAQTLSPPVQPVAMPVKAGEAATPGATRDKGLEVKTAARVQGAPVSPPTPSGGATKTEIVQAAAAAAGSAGKDADAEAHDPGALPSDAKGGPASDASQPGGFTTALNAQGAGNPAALAHATLPLRAVPQTVANLAAQMVRKLNGRSTRFDVELEPAGLGKVDVRVQIDAAGKMTAALNFDNQQAAAELKSRAGELQRAMEQAGFDLSGGLSFDVAGQDGQAQGQGGDAQPSFRGRAFQAVLEGGADSAVNPQTAYRQASASGVDIRI